MEHSEHVPCSHFSELGLDPLKPIGMELLAYALESKDRPLLSESTEPIAPDPSYSRWPPCMGLTAEAFGLGLKSKGARSNADLDQ